MQIYNPRLKIYYFHKYLYKIYHHNEPIRSIALINAKDNHNIMKFKHFNADGQCENHQLVSVYLLGRKKEPDVQKMRIRFSIGFRQMAQAWRRSPHN